VQLDGDYRTGNDELPIMESIALSESLRLLRRQSELEEAMHRPGGIRVTEEREIYELRETLKRFPGAVRAILEASIRLRRPVEALSARDVETGQ
jgi:hypothetical protein